MNLNHGPIVPRPLPERRDTWDDRWDDEAWSHADIARAFRASIWMLPAALLLIVAVFAAWAVVVAFAGPGPTA